MRSMLSAACRYQPLPRASAACKSTSKQNSFSIRLARLGRLHDALHRVVRLHDVQARERLGRVVEVPEAQRGHFTFPTVRARAVATVKRAYVRRTVFASNSTRSRS